MTEEEKKALEVVRDRKNHYGNENDLADRILADAFAAEHPPDDDEPVTEEWLLANGFSEPDDDGVFTRSVIDRSSRGDRFGVFLCYELSINQAWLSDYETTDMVDLKQYATRGQLRRLIAALES